jgi:hypothetical protein
MGFVLRLILALAVALIIGVASAWTALDSVPQSGFLANGAWRVAPDAGDDQLSLYKRAALAKTSLLAPDGRETLDLIATADETGAPLEGRCNYRIQGGKLPARSWSIAAYGPGRVLIANAEHRYALGPREAAQGDGTFVMHLSAAPQAGAWLPLAAKQRFSLTLRLYQPEREAVAAPERFNAPRIIQESCK